MALEQKIQDEIRTFIRENLGELLVEQSIGKPPVVYEVELRERIIRVEEELKHQRELLIRGFDQTDKRIEQTDKRIEELRNDTNRRFEQNDKRLEEIQDNMNKRFEQVDKRFEQVDKRFEQVDKRFEQVDKRFETLTRRIDRFMIWSFGLAVTSTGLIIAVIKL